MEGVKLKRTLESLERYRVQDLSRVKAWLFVVAILSIASTTYLYFVRGPWWMYTLGFGVFVMIVIFGRHLTRVERAFKEDLMPAIMARVDPALDHYDPAGLPLEQFKTSGLFDQSPDSYQSKDLYGGLLGSTAVAFAMVDADKKNALREGRHSNTLFEGLLFIADFNKNFRGRTHMRAGGAGFFASMRDAHVELEDPRFAAAFAVTSTDQIEARYLLTPALVGRLLALKESFDSVDAVFEDSLIVLALGASYGLLDPLTTDGIDEEDFDDLVKKLKEVVGIVEDLDLNTRIWSKKPVARTA